MRFTEAQLKQLTESGKIRGWKENFQKRDDSFNKREKISPKREKISPKGLSYIIEQLQAANLAYVTEYRFHDVRKYRFDIALPDKMIAIEYEGLISAKSRHTTISGYTEDANKYNLAQQMGWTVYRYTAKNYKRFSTDIIK